jgi:hypothetical protein
MGALISESENDASHATASESDGDDEVREVEKEAAAQGSSQVSLS